MTINKIRGRLKEIENNLRDCKPEMIHKPLTDKEKGIQALEVLKAHLDAENMCVTKVLTAYLGYEPKEQDYRNCTRLAIPNTQNYILCHLDVKLGTITKSFTPNNYGVRFTKLQPSIASLVHKFGH